MRKEENRPEETERKITMGSLFDGIGGFPLAAVRNGIEPVWASEIEAFPIKVTRLWFPQMQQVGGITRLDGAKLAPVDIISSAGIAARRARDLFLLRLGPAALFSTHEAWFFDDPFQLISVSLTHSLLMRPTRYCRASTTWGRMSPPMRTYMISSPTDNSPSLSQTRM